jgi:group I intron endonuclease
MQNNCELTKIELENIIQIEHPHKFLQHKSIISGVYKISCLRNNKIYIGSTQNIIKRSLVHFRTLRDNKHRNKHLQNAFNLYGWTKFTIAILEICSIDSLKDREQYWIDYYKAYDRNFGFNQTKASNSPLGYKHTIEAKQKMSKAKKGKKQPEDVINRRASKLRGLKRTSEIRKLLSQSKLDKGKENNPLYIYIINETKKQRQKRMAPMLSQPRWNKGKTKLSDPRITKLGISKIGKISSNALRCKLIDTLTNNEWKGTSLKHLSSVCPLSLPSINRIHFGKASKQMISRYVLIIL